MRLHVVSDVHGRVDALARAGDDADALICLGDLLLFMDYADHGAGTYTHPVERLGAFVAGLEGAATPVATPVSFHHGAAAAARSCSTNRSVCASTARNQRSNEMRLYDPTSSRPGRRGASGLRCASSFRSGPADPAIPS